MRRIMILQKVDHPDTDEKAKEGFLCHIKLIDETSLAEFDWKEVYSEGRAVIKLPEKLLYNQCEFVAWLSQ